MTIRLTSQFAVGLGRTSGKAQVRGREFNSALKAM
jgi:hypothetical protein